MKTEKMMKMAKLNGKTYTVGNLSYSRDKLIHYQNGTVKMDSSDVLGYIELFMKKDNWKELI